MALRDLREAFTPLPRPRDGAELVETGVYAHVRHPMYGGIDRGRPRVGAPAASPVTIALALVLAGLFYLKSRREEAWLVERFPDYVAYRAQDPTVHPLDRLSSRSRRSIASRNGSVTPHGATSRIESFTP